MSPWLLAAVIVLGLVGSAFFSGAEIAVISCNRLRMHHLVRRGSHRARRVMRLLENPRRTVTATLLGTNFCNVATAAAATGLFMTLAPSRGAIWATVAITPLILVFGEIFPKTLFRQQADAVCLAIAPTLDRIYRLLSPLVRGADVVASLLLGLVRSGRSGRRPFVSREEIYLLLGEGARKGLLGAEGHRMIHQAFSLSQTRVKAIMVPRVDIFALEETTPVRDALARSTEQGHSRIPLYRGRIDNIVGVLYVFDLLDFPAERPVGDFMHPVYYVPESKTLEQLLIEMKQSRVHLAVVVDEFGGASGVVTLEDALERIVGEIWDEYDRGDSTPPPPTPAGEAWTLLDARTPLDELWRRLDIVLPEGAYETVGGYLTDAFGRIPEPGEMNQFQAWEFEVLEALPQRVTRLRVRRRSGNGGETA